MLLRRILRAERKTRLREETELRRFVCGAERAERFEPEPTLKKLTSRIAATAMPATPTH